MRGVVFVLAAVIAAAVAIVAYDQLGPNGPHAASQGATSSSQSGDPLAELAGRLLLPSYLASGDNATYEMRLYPGQLPLDPKVDLPQPAGARLIGTALRLRNGAPASLDAVLDVPASTQDVAGLFERELTKLGWSTAPSRGQPSGGGFVRRASTRAACAARARIHPGTASACSSCPRRPTTSARTSIS